jgi:hypothetical protein
VFDHLLDSRPARERRLLSWILAVLLNAAVVAVMIATNATPRVRRESLPVVRTILPATDQPIIVNPPQGATNAAVGNAHMRAALPNTAPPNPVPAAPSGSEAPVPTGKIGPESNANAVTPDPRLRTASPVVTPLSPLDEARLRIERQIGRLNDSIATERASTEKARDWTKGEEGSRWGLTPGKVHFGSKTLTVAGATNNGPVPDIIRPPPGRRDELAARLQNWNEIQAQVARAEQRAAFSERVEAIRARVQSSRGRVATVKNK